MKFEKYLVTTKFNNPYQKPSHPVQFQKNEEPIIKWNKISDSYGLDKAYEDGRYFYNNKTLYIAGSHTARDWYDDFTKIPIWGNLKNSERYQQAKNFIDLNPGKVGSVVGHSLGSSVSLQLQKDYDIPNSRVYSSPVFEPISIPNKNVERYRNILDPVAMFDNGAQTSVKWNPFTSASLTHDYHNLADDKIY